ncbi:hypothetical protein [Dysgonomonas termitidis]|uniref:Uncharacterized protein n=1 Tax=Dysgonomonas termitidis TaxID=1516126 RepID=A0ABV9KRG3_9BACT
MIIAVMDEDGNSICNSNITTEKHKATRNKIRITRATWFEDCLSYNFRNSSDLFFFIIIARNNGAMYVSVNTVARTLPQIPGIFSIMNGFINSLNSCMTAMQLSIAYDARLDVLNLSSWGYYMRN